MNPTAVNPLTKHFRQPALYLKLPSGGAYWPDNTLELSAAGELAIFPMTTRDEITLRTPDALLNGQGVIDVVKSCCPGIKDPWVMPSVDVDAVLVAIRVASYGDDMEVNSKCVHCNEDNAHTIQLTHVLARFRMPSYENTVKVDGLSIKLKPQPYFEVNRTNMINFEEQRALQTIGNDSLTDPEKVAQFNGHMSKLVELNVNALANSVDYILTPDGTQVAEIEFIKDFFVNAPARSVKAVRDRLDDLAKEAELPKVQVQCDSCEEIYDMGIEFNYSSFFDQGS